MASKRGVLVTALVGICALGGAACGGSSSETEGSAAAATTGGGAGGSGTTTAGSGGSGPAGETLTLTLEPFDVQPGTERQVCKIINLPADVPFDVVRFRSAMAGTSHHFNAYKALTDPTAPASAAEGEVHDCSPAAEQLGGDAAYIFGAATPERVVDMPAGVAFHLLPQQRIILEQHVINATPDVIQGGVTFELGSPAAGAAAIDHHADVIWFAYWTFTVPPHQESSVTTHCTVPYDVEVFGLMSHTHQLGSHFSIEKWTPGGTEHLYESEDWAHPVYGQYNPTIPLAAGEGLQWTCTWNNTTPNLVTPGKESTNEMCMTFAYAYPREGLSGDPIQCN